jgi:hypothetical protein
MLKMSSIAIAGFLLGGFWRKPDRSSSPALSPFNLKKACEQFKASSAFGTALPRPEG